MLNSQRMVSGALALLALGLVFLIAHDILFPPRAPLATVRTAAVTRGSVRSAVTGTGTLVPAAQQNVNFRVAGQLTEVNVKVGDRVKAGQVLARIDPRAQQVAVDQAAAGVQSAIATLNNTINGNALQQAQHALDSARQSFADTQAQVNLTNQQDASQLAADQAQLDADTNQRNADQASLAANPGYQFDQSKLQADQAKLQADQQAYNTDGCFNNPAPPAPGAAQCGRDSAAIAADQAAVAADQQRVSNDQAQVNSDNRAVAADQAKVTADQNKQATDQNSGQRSLNSAQTAITAARDTLNSQQISRPNTIASQQAAVLTAQAALATANSNLEFTTLLAPVDGVVTALNGAAGESVGAGSGTTAQAPGSSAPQPSTSTASAASSSAFVVISNDGGMQVVVPFAEADAAKVKANQEGAITFDAVQGVSIPAHVLAVASGSTVVSNVVNYYATLTLDRVDQRLKTGMTANTQVVVSNASNVLVVPNSAITRIGGRGFVTRLESDRRTQRRVPVTLGVQGDTTTEVVTGVTEGDRIVLPQLKVPAGTPNRGLGGPAGGGAIRLGG